MTVRIDSVMTPQLITIPQGSTLSEAREVMTEKRIRHLPVRNPQDRILGILSWADVERSHRFQVETVDEAMTSDLLSVHPKDTIRQVILKMLERKVSSVLVADDDSRVLGIVTTEDFLWLLAHEQVEAAEKETSHLWTLDRQTIGWVADRLALMGI